LGSWMGGAEIWALQPSEVLAFCYVKSGYDDLRDWSPCIRMAPWMATKAFVALSRLAWAPHGQHGHLGECDCLTLNITPACRQDCCSAWFPGRRRAEFGLQTQAHGGFEMHTTSAPRPYLACLGTMQHGHERGQCVTAQGIPEVWEPLHQGRSVRSTARPSNSSDGREWRRPS
jgi:hypothetical protein